MLNFKQNEDAVSPVIGVILMVAITVILAAVIAAFVFGMTGNVATTKTVAVTAGQNGADVVLTYQGGADASTLQYLTITVEAGADTNTDGTTVNGGTIGATDGKLTKKTTTPAGTLDTVGAPSSGTLTVGAVMTIKGMGTAERDHVVVTGHFADGSDHVVLNTYV